MARADEALVLLAEAILLAGMLGISAKLWLLKYDPYPELVAELINATPDGSEILIVLPRPVRLELGRVCYAGACYAANLTHVEGHAWWWIRVYRRGGRATAVGG